MPEIIIHLHILFRRCMADVYKLDHLDEVRSVSKICFHHISPAFGHGLGNFRIAIPRKVYDSELIVDYIEVDSSCFSGTSADSRKFLAVCYQIEQRRLADIRSAGKSYLLKIFRWVLAGFNSYSFQIGSFNLPNNC